MLTAVDVRTPLGDLLTLTLGDSSNGYDLRSIEGLDPVKATLVSSSFAKMDGEQYHTSRREARDLKFGIEYEPDFVTSFVEDLRRRLYSFFMPERQADLRFHFDNGLYVDISGRVETFEAPLFVKDPAVDIVVRCFNPDFYDPNPVLFNGLSTNDTEEWTLFDYVGSIETGITFKLFVNRALPQFTIYHQPPDGTIRTLDFTVPLVDGDILEISTTPGAKGAWLTRAGTKTSVLYGVTPQSNWIQLQPGDNNIRVYATGADIPYSLEYTTKYGGL